MIITVNIIELAKHEQPQYWMLLDTNKLSDYKPVGSKKISTLIDIFESRDKVRIGKNDKDWWNEELDNMKREEVILGIHELNTKLGFSNVFNPRINATVKNLDIVYAKNF